MLAALLVLGEVHVLEHQARREGAHDRREAGEAGEPGEAEAEGERQREHHAPGTKRQGDLKTRGER